jgi:hypothetical protein
MHEIDPGPNSTQVYLRSFGSVLLNFTRVEHCPADCHKRLFCPGMPAYAMSLKRNSHSGRIERCDFHAAAGTANCRTHHRIAAVPIG